MHKYEHYISLGFFCGPAMDLERLGLRDKSYPFDWLISNMGGVIELIENEFDGFLDPKYFVQDAQNRSRYKNEKFGIWFYHDFDSYRSLYEQLPEVAEKYERRIKRFYAAIREPTLFVRYISDLDEVAMLEHGNKEFLNLLRSYNPANDILYIANTGIESSVLDIYNVERDEGDGVARRPLEKNPELNSMFEEVELVGKSENIKRYKRKEKRRRSPWHKLGEAASSYMKRLLLKEYCFPRIVEHTS